MRKILDKIIFMSEDDRRWVLSKLSDKERYKLKLKLSENHNVKIFDADLSESVVCDEIVIWKSEKLKNISSSKIVACLDKMPNIFVHIFLDYEGESARNYFINASKNSVLVRYLVENSLLKYPKMHGEAASRYFCLTVQVAP